MDNKELSRCEKKATRYRHYRNCFIFLCLVLIALCAYTITQWQQQGFIAAEMEMLYNVTKQDKEHYIQQWINTVIERNNYQQLYERCQSNNVTLS